MTCDEFVYTTLTRVCPGTYIAYDQGHAPALPWFAYSPRRGGEVFADDENYSRLPRYRVELLFKEMDKDLIARFEEALSQLGTWSLYLSDYLETERCLYHDYRLSLNLGKLREREASNG